VPAVSTNFLETPRIFKDSPRVSLRGVSKRFSKVSSLRDSLIYSPRGSLNQFLRDSLQDILQDLQRNALKDFNSGSKRTV